MKPQNPSGSSLSRAEACPGSHALPAVHRTSGEAALRGNHIHTYLEVYFKDGAALASPLLENGPFAWNEFCRGLDTGVVMAALGMPGAENYYELTYAFDWTTGTARVVGSGLERDYSSLGPTEIPGTADVVVVTEDRVIVSDYKTGRHPVAADSLQLLFLAYCAAHATGRIKATAQVLQWHTDDPSDLVVRAHELESWDLDAVGERLMKLGADVAEARGDVEGGSLPVLREGEQCRFCPAYKACPAKQGLERSIMGKASSRRSTTRPLRRGGTQ